MNGSAGRTGKIKRLSTCKYTHGLETDANSQSRHRMAAANGNKRTTAENLTRIVGVIDDFMQTTTVARRETTIRKMRDWILAMEDVTLEQGEQQEAATQQVVPALTQFFLPENTHVRRAGGVPSFIEEELTTLKIKWGRGDFDGSLHRGLDSVSTFDVNNIPVRTRRQVNRNWPHYTSGLYFGSGNLVNGQLWMSRAELARDGVHAPPIAGISGTSKKGAYSIVLGEFDEKKNEGYADIDMGEKIDYVGTALKDEEGDLGPTNEVDQHMNIPDAWNEGPDARKPTAATQAMKTSLRTGQPVRVIRSWKMCDIVKNKPRKGYRYDGLYRVVGETALKEARQIWSFQLERLSNQGRLRGFARNEVQPGSLGHRKGHFYRERRRGG